jgi:hypothetical protein
MVSGNALCTINNSSEDLGSHQPLKLLTTLKSKYVKLPAYLKPQMQILP